MNVGQLVSTLAAAPNAALHVMLPGGEFVRVRIQVQLEIEVPGKWHTLANQCYTRRQGMRLARAVALVAVWLERALFQGMRHDSGEPFSYPGMRPSGIGSLENHVVTCEKIEAIRIGAG